MNERIRELAKEAGVLADYGEDIKEGRYQIGGSLKGMEKFAELIVRECANLCKHEWNGDADTYEASNAYNECADLIKEHFGVEE